MTEGEKVQSIRLIERALKVHDEQIVLLIKEVYAMKDILKSPIRRAIHAAKEKEIDHG